MGSRGLKPRKPKHPLPKVPKGEVPNTIPLAGLGGGAHGEAGRLGHEHPAPPPGRFGAALLKMLGLRPRDTRAR